MRSYFLRTILLLVIIHIAYVLFAQPVTLENLCSILLCPVTLLTCDGGIMTRYIKPLTLYKQ